MKYELIARSGKVLCGCETLRDLSNMRTFYERNEPKYAPCYGREIETGKIILPILFTY